VSYVSIPPPSHLAGGFDRITAVSFSPEHFKRGSVLTLACSDGHLFVYDVSSLSTKAASTSSGGPLPATTLLAGKGDFIEAIAYTKLHILSVGQEGRICFWDTKSPSRPSSVVKLPGAALNVTASSVHPVAVFSDSDSLFVVKCTSKTRVLKTVPQSELGSEGIKCLQFSASGDQIVCGCVGGNGSALGCVKLLNFTYDEQYEECAITATHSFNAHTQAIYSLCISPCQKYMATGSGDTVVGLFDTKTMASVAAVDRLTYLVRTVAFSPDSKYVAAGGEDRVIDVTDLKGERVHEIPVGGVCETIAWHHKENIMCYSYDMGSSGKSAFPIQVKVMRA
jgi:WD40 repeat protein